MLRIHQLSKTYHQPVLDNINLQFDAGKVYGIIGKNGAGKTTLFKCIAGIEDFTGNIESDKENYKTVLGYLETESYFPKKLTGYEYIHLLCHARDIKTDRKIIEAKNIFNLPLNEYAGNYSTGMKKKLALVSVLFQNNDIFILDEPFNGVDLESNILIIDIIRHLKANDKTVIISSHILSTLTDTCDEIILLENGRVSPPFLKQDYHLISEKFKDFETNNILKRFFE